MAMLVCAGAMCACSFGMTPTPLMVTPENRVMAGTCAATVADCVPGKNLATFGMCSSLANPTVAAATAAALGVLTPMPCVPVPAGIWVPGSPTVLIGGKPALNNTSKLMCSWGGVIQITAPGSVGITVQ